MSPQITADIYTFDTVKEFIYLDSTVTTKNEVDLDIKRKITLANRCYYGFNGQLINLSYDKTNALQDVHPTRASLFRIQFNSELYELLNDIDVVQRINI